MPRSWKTLSSAYLIRRWWMNLRVDHVRLPDGTELPEFHVVEYPDWTATVCIRDDGRFVLVEQFRYGIGRTGLEFPSGALDAGETPIDGAKRELLEETGFEASEWDYLGAVAPEPSKHTNMAHLFVAKGAQRVSAPTPDAGEDLRLRVLDRTELDTAVDEGRFQHGIHLAALWLAERRGLV